MREVINKGDKMFQTLMSFNIQRTVYIKVNNN